LLILLTFSNVSAQFTIQKGMNISHWLSQSKKRGLERKDYFQKEDVEFLSGLGFDHIRIPIDEEQMWNEQGKKETEAFGLLHQAIEWSRQSNLKVIVDLHILRSHYFNAAEKPLFTDPKEQEKFYQLWVELSGELKKYPNTLVAYELMNEPVADDAEDWNKIVKESVKRLRKLEPNRTIVIGSNRWQAYNTLDKLYVPEKDKNIILSFHFYNPMLITHYRASWVGFGAYEGPVNYPGQLVDPKDLKGLDEKLRKEVENNNGVVSKAALEKMIREPLAVAKKHNLPLYCGEWGAYEKAPREARLQWYRDVTDILDKNNKSWATWDYKGGFGIKDNKGNTDEELIEILTGKNKKKE
jgi:endoglucanase